MNDSNIIWFIPFAWIWVASFVAYSIFLRRKQGKPIFPKPPPDAVFYERWTSGRSLKTPWSRIGGARNCLMVAVSEYSLSVTPAFPFNLMFLADIYGLEFNVDLAELTSIECRAGLFGKVVVVRWGQNNAFEFRCRDSEALERALNA